MTSVGTAVKNAFTGMASTAKVSDLQRNTIDHKTGPGLTTDHGVKISDTDNWYILSLFIINITNI